MRVRRIIIRFRQCGVKRRAVSDEYPKTYKGPYFSLVVPNKESEPTPEQLELFLDPEYQKSQLEKATEKTIQEIDDDLKDLLDELPYY